MKVLEERDSECGGGGCAPGFMGWRSVDCCVNFLLRKQELVLRLKVVGRKRLPAKESSSATAACGWFERLRECSPMVCVTMCLLNTAVTIATNPSFSITRLEI
jgi:hypothetical protein